MSRTAPAPGLRTKRADRAKLPVMKLIVLTKMPGHLVCHLAGLARQRKRHSNSRQSPLAQYVSMPQSLGQFCCHCRFLILCRRCLLVRFRHNIDNSKAKGHFTSHLCLIQFWSKRQPPRHLLRRRRNAISNKTSFLTSMPDHLMDLQHVLLHCLRFQACKSGLFHLLQANFSAQTIPLSKIQSQPTSRIRQKKGIGMEKVLLM